MEKKLFQGIIPVARPWFSEAEEEILAETVRSGWVTQGPRVRSFEQAVAEYVRAPFGVAANSCTSALLIGLELLGVEPGDEVILPSFTFIATANVIIHRGGRPVFVDINPQTYNLEPEAVQKAITSKTKVIVSVDQVGMPSDIDSLRALAEKKGIPILEDAACALGSQYKGKRIGGLNEISCFSFHPRKLITTGEGGMLVTLRKDYHDRARALISHGASIPDLVRHQSDQILIEEYRVCGHNFRMSDLQAALGLAQMKKLDEILSRKRALAERYHEAFSALEEVVVPREPEGYRSNYQSYLLRVLPKAKRSRDEIMEELLKKGVSTRRGIMAIHLEPAYRGRFGKFQLPETERAFHETMILPLYPQMTAEEQDYVIESLKETLVSRK